MLPETPMLTAYTAVLAALLGLVMGSFLNCLAWRMTHGESVLHGRSHCTSCGHVLGPADLIPVLSWVLSRGRCKYCGERVSWRYPATEVLCCVAYLSIALCYGPTLQTVELIAFASVLLVLSLTDLDEYIIPNATIVAAILIRVAYLVAMGATGQGDTLILLRDTAIGGVVVAVPVLLLSLVMDHVLGRESLGGGDIKLFFVAGMYFGWQQCLFLIVVACVLGLVFSVLGQRGSTAADAGATGDEATAGDEAKADAQTNAHLIPFGPSIAAACWITMLVGEPVLRWYLDLFLL
ncbi:MAG: prepilin peptidase [Coriobacteriales bacterium]|nr:prepilin peptidase [Coriobacteriales bacterium]